MGLFDGTPHWTESPGEYALKSQASAGQIGQLFLGGMRLAQQRDQHSQEMALRLKEFGAQEESRRLQNTLLQSKLDADASDAKAFSEWWPSFISTKDLNNLKPLQLRDPGRVADVERMIAGRIDLESGASAKRLESTIKLDAVKTVGSLHSDFRGPAFEMLKESDGVPSKEFNEYIQFAAGETERMAEETKLRVFAAEEAERRKTRLAAYGDKRIQHVGNKLVRINDDETITELFDSTGLSPEDRFLMSNAYRMIYNVNATAEDKAKAQAEVDAIRAKRSSSSTQPVSDVTEEEILSRPAIPAGLSDAEVDEMLASPKVKSKEQFDALPPGTVYIGEDGRKYRKP